MDLALFKAIANSSERMTLATIVAVKGSAPRHPGTKMLVGEQSGRHGTIGGGRSEARMLDLCRQSFGDRLPALIETRMLGAGTESNEMICGGIHRVLIEPIADATPYRLAAERLANGERIAFIKRFAAGTDHPPTLDIALVGADGSTLCGTVDASDSALVQQALQTGKPRFDLETGLFIDPIFPAEKLLILGGGHVGRALATAAAALDFQVTVVDDRPEVIAEAALPATVQTLIADYELALAAFPFDSATYVVVVTRGHQLDLACLRVLLTRDYRYAGLMGSLRKTRLLVDAAVKEGFDPVKIDALCAPIGLDIGAETPEELAIAILSEIVAFRRTARILSPLKQARKARWTVLQTSAAPDVAPPR